MSKSLNKPKLIVVCGPTATGKSDFAVELALYLKEIKHISCEIISADSRQVFTGLDIGTGKITMEEMKGVPHHLLDVAEPMEEFSVVRYKELANKAIDEILARGNTPILCGGTGQYIDAVVYDKTLPPVPANPKQREELEEKSIDDLLVIFKTLNKDQPHKVDIKNKRRIIRAIEILTVLGHIPEVVTNERFDVLWLGIDAPDQVLKDRINARLDKRMAAGMVKESTDLLAQNKITPERMRRLGLEYEFIADLLEQKLSPTDFTVKLNFAIWHYAKRQRTWFKRNSEIHWLDSSLSERMSPESLLEQATPYLD